LKNFQALKFFAIKIYATKTDKELFSLVGQFSDALLLSF